MKKLSVLLVCALLISLKLAAQFTTITKLNDHQIDAVAGTHDKSQSKVFKHDGKHWAVFANSTGTHLWRLDEQSWTHVLMLTTKRGRADCKVVGNVTHIFVYQDNISQLISVEYEPASQSYKLWSSRPGIVNITFNRGLRTASIDIDGTGRMWLAYAKNGIVNVQWSDAPYSTWSSPIILDAEVREDDAAAIIALPGKIGVLWSDQVTKRWGFKTHQDGADPSSWSEDEVPASQSASSFGAGMSDDHMNLKVSSDGTLYCAIKTGFNNVNYPLIALLVRRPDGTWDDLYDVSRTGTTPIVVLNEAAGKLRVIYSSKTYGGDILYNESSLNNIAIGPQMTLLKGTAFRDPTSSKQNFNPDGIILTTDATTGIVAGFHVSDDITSPPPPVVPAAPVLASPANAATDVTTTVLLSWNASADAASYQVQVATASDFAATIFDQSGIAATSMQLSDLSENTVYYWRALATNEAGNSDWSAIWSFTTAETTPPPTPTATLVGHWKMDEGSGSILVDASGFGNDAVIQNTPHISWIKGVEDLAVDLPGTWNRFAVAPNDPSLNITTGITIAAWIKPVDVRSRTILSKVGPDGYLLGISSKGKVEFWLNSNSNGKTYRLRSKTKTPHNGKQWMHVAATYDGTTSRIYINGEEDVYVTYKSTQLIGTNDADLMIGALMGTNRWNGALDDIKLYDGALDASEIMELSKTSSSLIANKKLALKGINTLDVQSDEQLSVYPNPFSSRATLNFSIPEDGEYMLTLYDSRGTQVGILRKGTANSGEVNQVVIDGSNLTKGLYIVRLQSANNMKSLRLMFNR